MDLRVFSQSACLTSSFQWCQTKVNTPTIKAVAEVALALFVNVSIGSSVASLPPLSLGLAVVGTVLLVVRPQQENVLTRSAHFLARLSLIHVVSLATIIPFVHESGHAVMAFLLFKNPCVQIRYHGLLAGASTTYTVSYGLTFLGRWLGKERSIGVIAAGGMISSTVWGMAAYHLCRYIAISQIYNEVIYAMGALSTPWNWSHDYSRLWMEQDVHPLFPVIGMTAALAYQIFG